MIKFDELNDPGSCLNKADIDEPLFVLRANDPIAPKIIRKWCDEYCIEKGGINKLTEAQKTKSAEASKIARDMERWKAEHDRKNAQKRDR